jgi:hypothetical protein
VTKVRRNVQVALAALAGAVAGALFARRRGPAATAPAPEDRTEELRRKLAEAREAGAREDDFEAAGMGAETLVQEPPPTVPARAEPEPEPAAAEEPPAEEKPARKPRQSRAAEPSDAGAAERPPADEFEAMRRRIHEEGRTAADEMRRSADPPEQT